jgi:hypothetical protein
LIAHEIAPIANSLWTATANSDATYPRLDGEGDTDVAIIGGGYTGLSAALHLAEAGVRVTLLEAETPGWGASGRNGGQINPGLKDTPDAIEARFGPEIGGRLVRLSGGAADKVINLIRRHAIACDPVQTGWIQPVHTPAALAAAQDRVAQWARQGAPVKMLSRAEVADLMGTDAYLGGTIDARGGNLHPLNYALGLAEAAQRAGAILYSHSRATRLDPDGDGYVIRTATGRLRARRVILGTNGYTDGLAPPLAKTLVPVRSIQVATAPLGDSLRRSILPGGQAASDSRQLLLYFRMDRDGRFIMGGRGAFGATGTLRLLERLRRVAVQIYPQLAAVDWTYAWGGNVAMTVDHYPHLNRLGPGVMAAVGYNGRGVAMATVMGKVLADWATGTPESELDFPDSAPQPVPFHVLRKPAVTATVVWYPLREQVGL